MGDSIRADAGEDDGELLQRCVRVSFHKSVNVRKGGRHSRCQWSVSGCGLQRVDPDQLVGHAVESQHLLGDSKTFVDAIAKTDPASILDAYRAQCEQPGFDLATFIDDNFVLPRTDLDRSMDATALPIVERIEELWDLLTRAADERVEHSSLIPLPNPYVVPGGRFREVGAAAGIQRLTGKGEKLGCISRRRAAAFREKMAALEAGRTIDPAAAPRSAGPGSG